MLIKATLQWWKRQSAAVSSCKKKKKNCIENNLKIILSLKTTLLNNSNSNNNNQLSHHHHHHHCHCHHHRMLILDLFNSIPFYAICTIVDIVVVVLASLEIKQFRWTSWLSPMSRTIQLMSRTIQLVRLMSRTIQLLMGCTIRLIPFDSWIKYFWVNWLTSSTSRLKINLARVRGDMSFPDFRFFSNWGCSSVERLFLN